MVWPEGHVSNLQTFTPCVCKCQQMVCYPNHPDPFLSNPWRQPWCPCLGLVCWVQQIWVLTLCVKTWLFNLLS